MSSTQTQASLTLESASAEQTRSLGTRIGALLRAGDVIMLQGDLGTGKTCLTQGLAQGLDIDEPVCSPTFIIVGEYRGRERLYHADLYRLDDPSDLDEIDLAHASEDGVLVVEWPERGRSRLPREHLLVRLQHEGGSHRILTFEAQGQRARAILDSLATP